MQNTIFSSSSESFLVAHIVHIGAVTPLAEEKQKNGNTHYFRVTTVRGVAYCRFKGEETARKARGVLGAMLGTVKPHLFRSRGDSIDLASIVSFGRIVELRNSNGECERYGLPLRINTADEKGSTLWLTFKSEESGQNVRKALWASLMSCYESDGEMQSSPSSAACKVEEETSQAEVVYSEV